MVLTCLRLLSYHFSDGFQAFSIIFAKFIIVYGVFDMLLIVFSMFVFCMQCAYMKYTGWEFDFHAKDLFRPFGAPSPGMPPASRASRPCAELRRMQKLTVRHCSFPPAQGPLPPFRGTFSGDATGIPRFAPVRGEGCALCKGCRFCRRSQSQSLPRWGRGTALAVDEVLGLNSACV